MAAPDFNKKTVETLAKRSAFICSNPDCRVSTVGPNSDPDKAIVIGEAAHILGARSESKRFIFDMADIARAEITNGIWLCRNCHKLIDSDDAKFTSHILYAWREEHERFVLSELGGLTDRIRYEQQSSTLSSFKGYSPLIRRIIIDKPDGWEWRLTAELMRHLNRPLFRKISDLRDGLYIKTGKYVNEEEIFEWVAQRLNEISKMTVPAERLLERLTSSWGKAGEAGDVEEIHHICRLIKRYLEEVVRYEETLYFTSVSEECEQVVDLLKDNLASQVEKFATIPLSLDEVVTLIHTEHGGSKENPRIIKKTITFDLPDGWNREMEQELDKLRRHYS